MTKRLVILFLLCTLSASAQVQDFAYTTNKGTITITKYTGTNNTLTIPSTITGHTVTSIGDRAFLNCTNLADVTIPNTVTSIGVQAFSRCTGLTSVIIGNSVTNIGCAAFGSCSNLSSVVIPNSVTRIVQFAFYSCTSLTSVYFKGDAPDSNGNVFDDASKATVYYLPGTKGWGPSFGGRPTAEWKP